MLKYMKTELPSLLGSIKHLHTRRWQKLEVLNQTAECDSENGESENNAGATPAADAKRNVTEIVAVSFDLGLFFEEPFGPELVRVFPVGRVVGEPPGVDEDLALGWNVEAAELGVVEVHVGDEKRDGHSKAEGFLDHRLEVGEARDVWLGDLDARPEN
ncbi:hypothetical protein MA16_Dca029010 [Dendrobium catenatum]|uniref:Uncharacterized protein n=1 Tax=Dendrobium catenatum TaxID=906689 RepID=A0A2I0VB93_9ASPA|nr:hypothetical protein MA16_Dca029010 [Dendrobium catenatum]